MLRATPSDSPPLCHIRHDVDAIMPLMPCSSMPALLIHCRLFRQRRYGHYAITHAAMIFAVISRRHAMLAYA